MIKNKRNFINLTSSAIVFSALTAFSIFSLSIPSAYADTTGNLDVNVTVPSACSITIAGAGRNNAVSRSATINPGDSGPIGDPATVQSLCNDAGGFAVYAVGFTNDNIGDNTLTTTTSSGVATIASHATPSGTTPDSSEWNMTIAPVPGEFAPTIVNETTGQNPIGNFLQPHEIPSVYTKIAYRNAATDVGNEATGAQFTVAFNAYVATDQPAGAYRGKVKFTLIHPSTHATATIHTAMLDTGQTVNAKMKSLAAGSSKTYSASDSLIKSISVHTNASAPSGFTASDSNTISSTTSESPIYIVFDNTNDAGIMHLYTEGDRIILLADSSYMFYKMQSLGDLLDLADWDTSNVANAVNMFSEAGYNATTFSLDVSNWDTSKVTSMNSMFYCAGRSATTWSIGDLSNWDTSNVTNMVWLFGNAGRSATTWSIGDLSNWDTSKVQYMNDMFISAGRSATTWSIGDLSDWNTSAVTTMAEMFYEAGYSASSFSLNLSNWSLSSESVRVENMFNSAGYSASSFSLNLSNWNSSKLSWLSNMFQNAGYSATAANWSVIIPQTNSNGVNNTTSRLYGGNTSQYATPPSGKSFTLAQ